ncbi:MAG: TIGR03067 domain-containing protein [Gemmataceae bacterium]|nr:TIGR03067 domain-containing protein [Gemmataceae bacterium]
MRILALVLLVLVAEPATDKDLVQGKWKVVVSKTGNKDTEALFLGRIVEFDGETKRLFKDGQLQEEGAFKLDPSKKPKWLDLFSPPGNKTPLLGIYSIEGNRLKLSWSKIDGKFRPDSFDLPSGKNVTRQISLVLERVKK